MDTLKLGQALQSTNPLVQVQAALGAGLYDVELLIVDSTGEQAKATLSFQILGRIIRPPVPRPLLPPVRGPVNAVAQPAVKPSPRPPAKRATLKKPKPPAPAQ